MHSARISYSCFPMVPPACHTTPRPLVSPRPDLLVVCLSERLTAPPSLPAPPLCSPLHSHSLYVPVRRCLLSPRHPLLHLHPWPRLPRFVWHVAVSSHTTRHRNTQPAQTNALYREYTSSIAQTPRLHGVCGLINTSKRLNRIYIHGASGLDVRWAMP